MADRYWVGADTGATANWNTVNSWSTSSGGASGASVPGSGDTAIFDGGGSKVGGCVIDAAVDVAGISATAGYTGAGANDGHIDNDTNDQTITVSGDATFACKTLSLGTATTWTCGGNWHHGSLGTLNRGSSTIKLTGSGKTFATGVGVLRYQNLEISAGASITQTTAGTGFGSAVINGSLECTADAGAGFLTTIGASGVLSGAGSWGTNTLAFTAGGQITIATFRYNGATTGAVIPAGTYDCGTFAVAFSGTRSYAMGAGNFIFNGAFTASGGTGPTLNLATYNPNVDFRGNVTITSPVTWSKGTGTITFSGAADQAVDLLDLTVEDIVINKSTTAAKVTFTNGWVSDSFTLTQGTLAFDATNYSKLRTLGDFTIEPGGLVDPSNLDSRWEIQVDGRYVTPPVWYGGAANLIVQGDPFYPRRRRLWAAVSAGPPAFKPAWARGLNHLIGGGVA